MNNPWKGLSSYEEKDKNIYEFRGRTNAANELYLMLSNNLFCTLYGKMGCGKTSLLQAGVFPLLRQESFLPVIVRLNMSKQKDLTDFVIRTIEEECDKQSVKIEKNDHWKFDNHTLPSEGYKLWEYLYSHVFMNAKQEYVFPVIAIDQIEEAFKEKYEQALELLSQLYYLVSDDLRLPSNCFANFRVITIIREDDLYLLEDAISDGGFNILRQNRYRLAPLTDNEALEIIELGTPYFNRNEKQEIIGKILKLSKEESSHVSTYMLSLICSQLFINSDGKITLHDILKSSTGLMQSFYESSIKNVSPETKEYIENNLVKEDRRNIVPLKEFKAVVGPNDFATLIDGEFKMVQEITAGTDRCIELIHDSLAKAIKKYKDEEAEKEEQERQRQLLIESKEEEKRELIRLQKEKLARRTKMGVIYALLFLIGAGSCAYYYYKQAEAAQLSEAIAQEQLGKSSIIINVKEDDAVRSLWWEAVLEVAVNKESKDNDTTYIFKIDKTIIKDSTFIVEDKNIKDATIFLRYPSQDNKNFEGKTITVTKNDLLRNEPYNISINLKKPVLYGGQVIMSDSLGDFQIENAIVIFGNEVTFTDGQGKFLFQLQEPNDTSEFIVIKKNFIQPLPKLVLGDYYRQEDSSEPYRQIVMNLEDSSNYFFVKNLCDSDIVWNKKEFENINSTNKNSSNRVMHSKKCDVIFEGAPHSQDCINFYLVFEGNKNGDMRIRGFYYYGNEKRYGYHCIVSGRSELHEDPEKFWYRTFEFESIDIANNKETIKGKYYTSDNKKDLPWEFNIFIGTKKMGGNVE